jgi:hypothetical protein
MPMPDAIEAPEELILEAPAANRLGHACIPALLLLTFTFLRVWLGGQLGLWSWIGIGLLSALTVGTFVLAILPMRLLADAQGLTFVKLGRARKMAWRDIEAIGVGRNEGLDGFDTAPVRFLAPNSTASTAKLARLRYVGVNMKPEASPYKDAGTRAYRRGLVGYEFYMTNMFGISTDQIVADLQARLDASRRPQA